MTTPYKSTTIFFAILLFLTLIVGYIYYGTFNLLVFINTSFIFSSIFLFLSLLLVVTKNRFFDGITYGLRKAFAFKQADKELDYDIQNEMRPPSELVEPVPLLSMFLGSFLLFLCMIFSLLFYY